MRAYSDRQPLGRWCSAPNPAYQAGIEWSMDSGDLYHGMTIRAENLRLASLCPVHGRIDSHIMGNMGGCTISGGNHVSHAVALALLHCGALVNPIEKHCITFLSIDGWLLVV